MTVEKIMFLLDQYNLPWLLWAAFSWLAIGLSCTGRQFREFLPAGIWTSLVGAILEQFFIVNKFWTDRFILVAVGELDLFVVIGPFFALGIMLLRFLPHNRAARFFAVLFWAAAAMAGELLSVRLGFLEYQAGKWSSLHSLAAYYLGLMSTLGFHSTR